MNAWVRLTCGEATAELYPGCIVGRSWRSDLIINDPRVSEVHAVVSLRGGALKLRPLGGNLWLFGMPVEAVVLARGQRIALAEDLELLVEELVLPDRIPALRIDDCEPIALEAPRVWVDAKGVHSRPVADSVELWSIDETWYVGTPPKALEPVQTLGGYRLELVQVARKTAESQATMAQGLYAPLKIVARFDTVQIHQANQPVLLLSGKTAQLISELAALGPVSWKVVASELWSSEPPDVQRRRWDKTLATLRRKLREAHIRPDLVRSSAGRVSLVLIQDDQLDLED